MAKGIEKLAVKFCVETAVYWGNPVNDGFGGFIFDTPVEIPCRWENKNEVITGLDGREYTTNASLLLTQDVTLRGFMYRGFLLDLAGQDLTNPKNIKDAYYIMRFDRIPMVRKTDEFIRTCYLYQYHGK